MTPKSSSPRRSVFLRFLASICLVAIAPTALADYDCQYWSGQGYSIGAICASHFDANGNYDYSHCMLPSWGDPWSRYQPMCKVGIDPGTCIGSNCEQEPWCTWDGPCTTDLDCCGMNTCDQDFQRCKEENNGGQS